MIWFWLLGRRLVWDTIHTRKNRIKDSTFLLAPSWRMYNKRSTLFLTELLLLFLISQLFWPIEWYIHSPIALQIANVLLFVASWVSLLVLPWRWRSYLFFDDIQIGNFERFIVSLAISLALVVFSAAYLQVWWVALYPWTILVMISVWLFLGILVAFFCTRRAESSYTLDEISV